MLLQSMRSQRVGHNLVTEQQKYVTCEWWFPKRNLGYHFAMKTKWRDFPVIQWLRLQAPKVGGLVSVPSQRARFHMLQLRPSTVK